MGEPRGISFRMVLACSLALLLFLAFFDAWTVLVPTAIAGGLLVASSNMSPRVDRLARPPACAAALVVGDELVHRGSRGPDRGGNVLPRTWMVVGLAMEIGGGNDGPR